VTVEYLLCHACLTLKHKYSSFHVRKPIMTRLLISWADGATANLTQLQDTVHVYGVS